MGIGTIVGVTLLVTIILGGGGGFFYWIYVKNQNKRQSWKANVYQLGKGVHPPDYDKNGKIVRNLKLRDLKPYTVDTIERVDKEHGVVIFQLKKLGKVVPNVTAEYVEYWGEKDKRVDVLLDGETATLLKKGYSQHDEELFSPMPYDRINLIKSEIAMRKARLGIDKQSTLTTVLTYVLAGLLILGSVATAYLHLEKWVQVTEMENKAQEKWMEHQGAMVSRLEDVAKAINPNYVPPADSLGNQNKNSATPPPPVEG